VHFRRIFMGGAAAVTVLSTVLIVGACGTDESGTTPASVAPVVSSQTAGAVVDGSGEDFNDADITFAQEMIPHHRQAVEMAALTSERTENVDLLALAQQISAAQQPEIDTMTGLLDSWGAEVPADMTGMGEMEGMDHGPTGMPGMMSAEEMASLEAAQGADFDRMFFEMMIAHHEGAIEMAQVELDNGADPAALALAQEIIDAQQAEIMQMQGLLDA